MTQCSSSDYAAFPSTAYAEGLCEIDFVSCEIRPLWNNPRIGGPAFTVRLGPADNLMLHAAIYQAPAGSILVVEAADARYAVAGGNVCAVAKARGIQGMIIDGVIRDIEEIRQLEFPVYARGLSPVPGRKEQFFPLAQPITCGGALVRPNDIVVADADGVVILRRERYEELRAIAQRRVNKEESECLDDWMQAHQAKINSILNRFQLSD
ncbi:MAG: RraA family protein [Lentisphaerae bacterium]|nr:MAG: RraA family protein [Lentisphaerota bacterium]